MYIFQVGEMVYYTGDDGHNPISKKKALAFVEHIDENLYPWVGVKLYPSNETVNVHYRSIRSIHTKVEHLKKLGFEEKEIKSRPYYEREGIYISDVYIVIKPNHIYLPQFRFLPNLLFTIDLTKYLKEGKTDGLV